MGQRLESERPRSGASIHPFPPRRQPSEVGDFRFAFRIDNYAHLTRAYGPAVAHQAVEATCDVLSALFDGAGLAVRAGGGLIHGFLWDRSGLGEGPVERACERFVQAVSSTLATRAIYAECEVVHVSVSGAWNAPATDARAIAEADDACEVAGLESQLRAVDEAGASEAWARRYRADMADTVDLFALLNEGRLAPVWRPVRSTQDGRVFCQHCELRAAGCEEGYASPSRLAPAAERLGLVRPLDQHVVRRVVSELEAHPDVSLSVSISSLSATLDGWWLNTLERLQRRPDVARRLIVTITDTVPFPSAREAVVFARRLRELRVRVALDEFGAGQTSVRQLLDLAPDLIKIAPAFLQRARLSEADCGALRRVMALADALAPAVVVGGADTDDLVDIARAAGARWHRGAAMGGARIARPWLTGAERSTAAPVRPRPFGRRVARPVACGEEAS